MTSAMRLVPIVAPYVPAGPERDFDRMHDYITCLYREGWSVDQVGEWSKAVWMFSPLCLRTSLTVRGN